jgi:hypothetical protein
VIKQTVLTHFTGTQLVYIAFAIYANYQVFKWLYNAVKFVATSHLLNVLVHKLTPKSIIQQRIQDKKQMILDEKVRKEKQHQEALEIHRKYEGVWFKVGFIEEDRATLFKGYEDIKWQWGWHRVENPQRYYPDDSRHIAFMMFQEMAIYRWQFMENNKWTPEMEVFWRKILPKQFVKKRDYFDEQAQQAATEFESDAPTKASA